LLKLQDCKLCHVQRKKMTILRGGLYFYLNPNPRAKTRALRDGTTDTMATSRNIQEEKETTWHHARLWKGGEVDRICQIFRPKCLEIYHPSIEEVHQRILPTGTTHPNHLPEHQANIYSRRTCLAGKIILERLPDINERRASGGLEHLQ